MPRADDQPLQRNLLEDLDDYILEANKRAGGVAVACPIHYPPMPS